MIVWAAKHIKKENSGKGDWLICRSFICLFSLRV